MLLMMVAPFRLAGIANFSKTNSDCENSQVPRSSNVFGPMSLLAHSFSGNKTKGAKDLDTVQ